MTAHNTAAHLRGQCYVRPVQVKTYHMFAKWKTKSWCVLYDLMNPIGQPEPQVATLFALSKGASAAACSHYMEQQHHNNTVT